MLHDQHVSPIQFPYLPVFFHLHHSLLVASLQDLCSNVPEILLQKASNDNNLFTGIHPTEDELGPIDILPQNG